MFGYHLLILEEFEWIGRGKGGGLLERRRREFFLSNLEREREVEINNLYPKTLINSLARK
jgi:hypothetical protein